ncbi:DUF3306 domain-containing protein [Enterovibrio paralichthyis]|uniref:DUF3306 domain-containing protein n=1 Tax=Enterovibrio paralichthyis TaxID=2853805 RepID=UPI001C4516C5|nr:DUF3306 domain-containing protein [Enterovibrio paralichthyis]
MATDSFLHRWSKRKQEQTREGTDETAEFLEPATEVVAENADRPSAETVSPETDDEQQPQPSMEDVERLKEGDSASAFLAKGVSSQVKKAALRKLFHSEAYNIRDGMNDYDFDYTNRETLSAEVAQSLRQWTKEKLEPAEEPEPDQEAMAKVTADEPLEENGGGDEATPDSETKSTHEEKGDKLS